MEPGRKVCGDTCGMGGRKNIFQEERKVEEIVRKAVE